MRICPPKTRLAEYRAGALSGTEAEALSAHVRECPSCQAALTESLVVEAVLAVARPAGPETVADPQATGAYVAADPAAPLPVIPGYEILGELGRGGMGVVYQARQLRLDRVVALKMVRAGTQADTDDLARFHAEAQAVARLQHPNIVQVHEVGEHGGQPFFSLEFVEGGSLARRLAGAPQPPREAAALVETLARAVQYAHEQGIVHRDLKPSNVLLTAGGAPKIADFGLAKRLDADSGQTHTGQVMGTPSYMAPEQAAGQVRAIGPATDVYALGAILYELLTGRPPFRGASLLETLEQVRQQEVVPAARLQPKVPRDLDTICLKCLQKEPGKRYASAGDMAEDLRRYLAGEPIRARPISAAERLYRWARRNKKLAVSLLLFLLAFVGSIVLGVVLYFALAEAERSASRERLAKEAADEDRKAKAASLQKARDAVDQMLTEVGNVDLKHVPQMEPIRRKLLEKALRFYQEFLEENSSDPSLRLAAAEAHTRVGLICSLDLGRHAEAAKTYEDGIAILSKVVAEFPAEPAYRAALANARKGLGDAIYNLGRAADALKDYQKALELWQELARDFPAEPYYQQEQIPVQVEIMLMLHETGQNAEAERRLHQVLPMAEALVRERPATGAKRRDLRLPLSRLYAEVAGLLNLRKQSKEATNYYRKAVALRETMAAEQPGNPGLQASLGAQRMHLAGALVGTGEHQEAEKLYRENIALFARLTADFPSTESLRVSLAVSHAGLFGLLTRGRRFQEAAEAYRSAMEAAQKIDPKNPQHGFQVMDNFLTRGAGLRDAGRPDEAVKAFRQGLETAEKRLLDFPSDHGIRNFMISGYNDLGNLARDAGRLKEAEDAYQRAIEIWQQWPAEARSPASRWGVAESLVRLAGLVAKDGRLRQAENLYRKGVEILPGYPDAKGSLAAMLAAAEEPRKTVEIYTRLASQFPDEPVYWEVLVQAESKAGRFAEAAEFCRQGLRAHEKQVAGSPPSVADLVQLARQHERVGDLLARAGRPAEAKEEWARAVADHAQALALKPGDIGVCIALYWVYEKTGDWADARAQFAKVIERDPNNEAAWHFRGYARDRLGDRQQAITDYDKAIALKPTNETALYRRGLAHANLGHWHEAIRDYTRTVELQKNWWIVWNARGNAYYRLRQWDKAVADYSQAIELGPPPQRAVVHMNRANAYAEWAHWKDAAADAEVVRRLNPKDPQPRIALALLSAADAAGYQKACRDLLRDTFPDAAAGVAWTCCVGPQGVTDYTPLVALAEKAAAADKSYVTRRALGAVLYRAGKYDAAIERLQEAMALQEQSPSCWLFLAMAHSRAGQVDEARKLLKKAEAWIGQVRTHAWEKTGDPNLPPLLRLPWAERLILETLRQEAASLLQEK